MLLEKEAEHEKELVEIKRCLNQERRKNKELVEVTQKAR